MCVPKQIVWCGFSVPGDRGRDGGGRMLVSSIPLPPPRYTFSTHRRWVCSVFKLSARISKILTPQYNGNNNGIISAHDAIALFGDDARRLRQKWIVLCEIFAKCE